MLARDAHVARRNAFQLVFQTFLQPLLFVFVFGRVMVGIKHTYKVSFNFLQSTVDILGFRGTVCHA